MPDVFSVPTEVVEKDGVKMLAVRARLNGGDPLILLVDTGCTKIVISDLVTENVPGLGKATRTDVEVGTARKEPIKAALYRLNSIEISREDGTVDERQFLELLVMPLPPYESRQFHGYLGMSWMTLFPRVCLRFDLDPPRLELHVDS